MIRDEKLFDVVYIIESSIANGSHYESLKNNYIFIWPLFFVGKKILLPDTDEFHETHFLLDFLPVKSCQKDFFLVVDDEDFEGSMLVEE